MQGYIFINTTCTSFQQDSSLRFSQSVRNYGCNPSDYNSSGYHVSRVQLSACALSLFAGLAQNQQIPYTDRAEVVRFLLG